MSKAKDNLKQQVIKYLQSADIADVTLATYAMHEHNGAMSCMATANGVEQVSLFVPVELDRVDESVVSNLINQQLHLLNVLAVSETAKVQAITFDVENDKTEPVLTIDLNVNGKPAYSLHKTDSAPIQVPTLVKPVHEIKAIHIQGRLWHDKLYGNTYHSTSSTIYGNQNQIIDTLSTSYEYGYGNQYIFTALKALAESGLIPPVASSLESWYEYQNRTGILVITSCVYGLKKDMYKAGK